MRVISKRIFNFLFRLSLLIGFIFLILFFNLYTWISYKPQSFDSNSFFGKTVNFLVRDYDIKFEKITIHSPYFRYGADISLSNISLENEMKDVRVGEIKFNISLSNLFLARVVIDNLKISGVEAGIQLNDSPFSADNEERKEKKSKDIYLGIKNYNSLIFGFKVFADTGFGNLKTKKITFDNILLNLNRPDSSGSIEIPKITLLFYEHDKALNLEIEVALVHFSELINTNFKAFLGRDNSLTLKLDVENLDPSFIALVNGNKLTKDMYLAGEKINGGVSLRFDDDGVLKDSKLEITKSKINDDNISLDFSSSLLENENEEKILSGELNLKNLKIEDIGLYWPKNFSEKDRKVILGIFEKGTLDDVNLQFEFAQENLNNQSYFTNLDFLNDVSMQASMRDFIVKYSDDLPKIINGRGGFLVEDKKINLLIENGEIEQTKLKETLISIYKDQDSKDIFFQLDLNLDGSLKDFYALLPPETDVGDIEKNTSGEFLTSFIVRKPLNADFFGEKTDMIVSSKIKNFAIKNFQDDINISGGNFDLSGDKEEVVLSGDLKVDEVGVDIVVVRYLGKEGDQHHLSKIHIKSNPSDSQLMSLLKKMNVFGKDDERVDKMFSGNLDLDLKIFEIKKKGKDLSQKFTFKGRLDLEKTAVNLPYINWRKKLGQKAYILFEGDLRFLDNKEIYQLTKFSIHSEDGDISNGDIDFSIFPGKNAFSNYEINFTNLVDRNNFSATYKKKYNSVAIDISGEMMDMSNFHNSSFPVSNKKNFESANESEQPVDKKKEKTNYILNIDLAKLAMANDVSLLNLKAIFDCSTSGCGPSYLQGKFDDGSELLLSYDKNDQEKYEFQFFTENIRNFLKGFGIKRDISTKEFLIKAKEVNASTKRKEGQIYVEDLTMVNTPIFANLLSLASFSGILNNFRSEGINVGEVQGDFFFDFDRKLILNNLIFNDAPFGFTLYGVADLEKMTMNFEGAVTPAYGIGRLISKTPILGTVLTGREGEGLVATKYYMVGDITKPKITVNPLSNFTPGIIRNLWGTSKEEKLGAPKKEILQ